MTTRAVTVREMRLEEVGIRIEYFHSASDDYLHTLGVERALLPTPGDWYALYEEDYLRPIEQRVNYQLIWELDGSTVGFSSADRIVYGVRAFMHLHILNQENRKQGLGVEFVRKSARVYFTALQLDRLFSEPNAFNVAPNRTLQRAGFRYLFTHETKPSAINYRQVMTRWVLDRAAAFDRAGPNP